ncbi:MAG TPA: 3-hydroxyacyl-ACP dehydratase [Desulfobulbaceae bacterium]|nr:3-hydroxyacyl-ACP dehydratase [Desulfobulbaceae bacterium]HHD62789.1 3-hydroxyacyl-ACP dehydratase [Desulfobulbaceae bacterium]
MYAGVDLGSRTIKIALWQDGRLVDHKIEESGFEPHAQARNMLLPYKPRQIVATGYGRHLAREHFADQVITEIKAHAMGIHALFPNVTTIVDIGGQDSKVIALKAKGQVANFQMNDKCAAGTGRFLEIMAASLAYPLKDFGPAALASEQAIQINSMCTVFAESEVISMKNSGVPREHIARAVHSSVADRIVAMLNRIGFGESVAFSGGVANNPCIVRMVRDRLENVQVILPDNPSIVGALGAAIAAAKRDVQ